jgi:hypothetical protein
MKGRLRHNTRRYTPIRVFLFAVLLIGVGLFMPRLFSSVSAAVMLPFHSVHVWLQESSSLIPVFLRDRQSLHDQIASLEYELAVASRGGITQQRLIEENNRLRGLLGVADEQRIAAGVIARPDNLPYDLLQIDRGSTHGIEVGAPVFIGKDTVIGLVVHTAERYAFVQLVTTPGFVATAFISGPDVIVSLEGMGAGVARVRVPQGIPLRVGNVVHLPSVEPGIFGRIVHIENRPTQPEQYGYISPDVPIASINIVAVGTLSQRAQSVAEIENNISELMRTALQVEDVSIDSSTTTGTTSATAGDVGNGNNEQ